MKSHLKIIGYLVLLVLSTVILIWRIDLNKESMNNYEEISSQNIEELLSEYLSILLNEKNIITANEAEYGQLVKKEILRRGNRSIPVILNTIESSTNFLYKDYCYDLLIEMGPSITDYLLGEVGERDSVIDIWIAGVLFNLNYPDFNKVLSPLTNSKDHYTKYLAALSLAFLYHNFDIENENKLKIILLEALNDNSKIEASIFTISGSSLGVLAQTNVDVKTEFKNEIILYNHVAYVLPPPIHPFPFFADHFSSLDEPEKQNIIMTLRK